MHQLIVCVSLTEGVEMTTERSMKIVFLDSIVTDVAVFRRCSLQTQIEIEMEHRTLLQTDEKTRFTWIDVFTVTPHVFRRLMII